MLDAQRAYNVKNVRKMLFEPMECLIKAGLIILANPFEEGSYRRTSSSVNRCADDILGNERITERVLDAAPKLGIARFGVGYDRVTPTCQEARHCGDDNAGGKRGGGGRARLGLMIALARKIRG